MSLITWVTAGYWKPVFIALTIALAIGAGVHFYHKHIEAGLVAVTETLRQENRKTTDDYWEAIGERNALRVQAQQFKLEADAYRQAGEQRGANVAALDAKINTVRGKYEEIQNTVGDCSSVAECRKQLCEKYKQAGIRLKSCPD